MNENIGKICPFCKTEITAEDTVTVCPDCGIPHHEGCWQENKGCTTFGCAQQHYEPQHTNPTAVCANCGTPLGDGQMFCPKCGTPKAAPAPKNVCGQCGTELQEGQSFCPKCGTRAGFVPEPAVNSAISQFNAQVEQQKKKSNKSPIIIAVVAAVALLLGIFAFNTIQQKQAEEAREEYLEAAEEFMTFSLTAGSNLEDITDTVQTYWYENIWYDKHGSDINDAIRYALRDKATEINTAETHYTKMKNLYDKLKKVPSGISDEDRGELEDICDAIQDLYSVYLEFYTLATDPSGSYNSYSEANGDLTDEYVACYKALKNLLD